MRAAVSAGCGFLVAVLWFDLMFDTLVRGHRDTVPADDLATITSYYRRATTGSYPMNRLVAAVMAVTLGAVVVQLARGIQPAWVGWCSLLALGSGIGLAAFRTVRNAKRLGRAEDPI